MILELLFLVTKIGLDKIRVGESSLNVSHENINSKDTT
jgi:hypothetical protein